MMARTMAVVMTVGQSGSAVDGDSTKESDAGDDRLMVVATRVMMILQFCPAVHTLTNTGGPFLLSESEASFHWIPKSLVLSWRACSGCSERQSAAVFA